MKKIAQELVKLAKELMAGHSYTTDIMYVVVWGKQPFNVDVMRAINGKIWIDIKGDDGEDTTGSVNLMNHQTAKGALTWMDEKKGMVKETVMALNIPKGYNDEVVHQLRKTFAGQFHLKCEEVKAGYVPKIRKD